MPVNRYDIPANYEYMQLPYQELLQAGALRQQRFDEEAENLAKIQGLIDIKADPKHVPLRNELITSYNDKITDITDRYLKTGDANVLREARNLKNKFTNDPTRRQLEANYADYLKYQEDAQKLKEKQVYDEIYDPYSKLKVQEGTVSPFSYKGMKSITDFYKPAQEMMKGIKPSADSSEWYEIDKNGNIIGKKEGWEEVAQKDVNRVAASKAPLFLSHQDSQYFKDKYLSMNPNATTKELLEASYDYLKREGENQIFSKTEDSSKFDYAPEYVSKGGQDNTDFGYDDIAASTWKFNPLGKDITEEGQSAFAKLFGFKGATPRYDALTNKTDEVKDQLNKLKNQLKPNVTDTQLNSQIQNKEVEFNNLTRVNETLEKMYKTEQERANTRGLDINLQPYIDSTWHPETIAEVQRRWEQAAATKGKVDKNKFFEENFDLVANEITQYQRAEKLDNNAQLNYEIATSLTNQGSKKVYGTNGETMTPEVVIPTGYVTDLFGKGMVNQSHGYFSKMSEAEKSGLEEGIRTGEIITLTYEEANNEIQQALKAQGQKNNTIPTVFFSKDQGEIYRVPVYSETSTGTKDYMNSKKANPAITAELDRWETSTMNRGPIYNLSDDVQIKTRQTENGDAYEVSAAGQTFLTANKYDAMTMALKANVMMNKSKKK